MSSILTIPKSITGSEELVILPKKELEKILSHASDVRESDILCWSSEAKKWKKAGQLPVLRSLKFLR